MESRYVESLMDFIDANMYIELYLDHYYVIGSDRYEKRHLKHWSLIYGYDDARQIFYCADNFLNGKYVFLEVPYSCIEASRLSMVGKEELSTELKVKIFNYYLESPFEFDVQMMKNIIRCYLDGTFDDGGDDNLVFGVAAYDYLLDDLYVNKNNNQYVDVRPFHVWSNQKELFLRTISYLQDQMNCKIDSELVSAFENLYAITLLNRNAALKFNITKNDKVFDQIITNISLMQKKERICLEELLACL